MILRCGIPVKSDIKLKNVVHLIMKRLQIVWICSVIFFNVFASFSSVFAQDQDKIVILRSQDISPYNSAVYGFKDEMDRTFTVSYQEYQLEDYADREDSLMTEIENDRPTLIFAVGTEAAMLAKNNIRDIPVIFSMVLNPVESGVVKSVRHPDDNITGISLKISIEKQFRKIKEIFPNVHKIGMLYDAKNMVGLKKEAESAAENLDLTLVAKAVNSTGEVDDALNEVINEADILWAGVDKLIYNPQSAQHILLATLRNKIPFMAFSSNYVNAGALMALECDYVDIGRQSADLAIKVLNGEKASEIPVVSPRMTRLVINEKTAQLIGVKIPKVTLQ